MKEQEFYQYVAGEKVKSRDENNNVESIKLKKLGSGTIPAFDPANAKIKVTALIMAKPENKGVDVDEMVILVSPFRE